MKIYDFIKNTLNEDSVIFEIGSHMGLDTKKIKDFTRSVNIHCFECDPRNIEIFKNQEIDVFFNPIAVSDKDGIIGFYQSTGNPNVIFDDSVLNENDWTASSSTKIPKDHLIDVPWCKFKESINVNCTRVDTYCKEKFIDYIDFVWMDVQGAEKEVISGFGDIIKKTRFIYTEYSDREFYEDGIFNKDSISKILGEDWTIVYDFGTDLLLENKIYKNDLRSNN
jgi:FkbM family methyltransferase